MQCLHKLHKKIIAYVMIFLLVIHFFWTPEGSLVRAENISEKEAQTTETTESGEDTKTTETSGDEQEAGSKEADTEAPVITIDKVINDDCYNTPVELAGIIQEANFDTAEAFIEVVRVFDGETFSNQEDYKDTENYVDIEREITLEREEQEFFYPFYEEGEYEVIITAKDTAGNEAEELKIHFVIDRTAPILSILGVSDGFQTKEEVTINCQAVDRNHDYEEYGVYVVRTAPNGDEEVVTDTSSLPDVSDEEQDQKAVITEEVFTYTEEGKYEITFFGIDKAGNKASEKLTFYIDQSAPVISKIGYSNMNGTIMEKYGVIYSNQAILMEFDVYDAVAGVDEKKVYVTLGSPEDYTGAAPMYIAHRSIGNRYYVVVPTDFGVENFDDVLTIWASDVLGHQSYKVSANVVFNTDYPNITMDCDVDYSKWTNQDVTFHTYVSDSGTGIKEVIYKIDGEEVKKVEFDKIVHSFDYDLTATKSCDKVSGYTVSVEVKNNAGTINVAEKQVFIDKDRPKVVLSGVDFGAHYNGNQSVITNVQDVSYSDTKTIYVINRTMEGKTVGVPTSVFYQKQYDDSNKMQIQEEGLYEIYAITTDAAGNQSVSNTIQFVIDKTAPRLSISGTSSGTVSGTPITLDFDCEESFFETNEVMIKVVRELDGTIVTEQLNGFPTNAKFTSMSHTFSEDGTYEVILSAVDKAGNVAKLKSITFTVDRTKPEIRISGTKNYEQWDMPMALTLAVTESYFAGSKIEIKGTRTDIDGKIEDVNLSDFRYTGKISSLTTIFDQDGYYDLEVVAKDEAGNRESARIHFTIDCTAPEIHKVRELNGEYCQEFKLADSMENVFKDLTVLSYHLLLNGVEYNGTDVIDQEGKYNLYVDAEDELGHVSSESVEFIIDHTAPKVIFTGAKDGETVHESGAVLLSLANSEDEVTAVRMNGKDYGSDVRRLAYKEYGSYRIEVDCVDKAGNSVTRSIYFVYNNPVALVLLFGGIGIFLIGMCAWIVFQTRKKETKERKKG